MISSINGPNDLLVTEMDCPIVGPCPWDGGPKSLKRTELTTPEKVYLANLHIIGKHSMGLIAKSHGLKKAVIQYCVRCVRKNSDYPFKEALGRPGLLDAASYAIVEDVQLVRSLCLEVV